MLKLKDEPKENYGTLDGDNDSSSDGMEDINIKEMDKVATSFHHFCQCRPRTIHISVWHDV